MRIDGSVDHADEEAQGDLGLARERRWVHNRNNVLVDEASRVLGCAGSASELVLKWGERAYPPAKFEQGTPQGRGNVHPGNPAPAQGQRATEHNEDNERQVDEDDEVCETCMRSVYL